MMRYQRRKVLIGASAALLTMPLVLRAQPAPFRFGLTPVFLGNDWQLLDLLRAHLSTRMGREVEFLQRRTYKEVTALLLDSGLIEIHSQNSTVAASATADKKTFGHLS